jgi:hypothetical protein
MQGYVRSSSNVVYVIALLHMKCELFCIFGILTEESNDVGLNPLPDCLFKRYYFLFKIMISKWV